MEFDPKAQFKKVEQSLNELRKAHDLGDAAVRKMVDTRLQTARTLDEFNEILSTLGGGSQPW